ncbi:hypothetical protein FACS189449_03430 [Alphaproteobacteria bacterium]|nr:hypothetical protein FACS189449_03430 [Alphaproteobacteria bacterium]
MNKTVWIGAVYALSIVTVVPLSAMNERLHEAVRNHQSDVVKNLIADGVDVNARNKHGETALHRAVIEGDVKTVLRLLAAPNINVNARDQHNATPLHYAVPYGKKEIVALLLGAPNIDVNAKNLENKTPLNLAIDLKLDDVAELF